MPIASSFAIALNFYPRSPCGERPCGGPTGRPAGVFLSTLSLRRATGAHRLANAPPKISIHALLAESDRRPGLFFQYLSYFYPRSPCGERPCGAARGAAAGVFLSTLSLRRATVTVLGVQHRTGISIHALLAESDHSLNLPSRPILRFLSTLSLRRATGRVRS